MILESPACITTWPHPLSLRSNQSHGKEAQHCQHGCRQKTTCDPGDPAASEPPICNRRGQLLHSESRVSLCLSRWPGNRRSCPCPTGETSLCPLPGCFPLCLHTESPYREPPPSGQCPGSGLPLPRKPLCLVSSGRGSEAGGLLTADGCFFSLLSGVQLLQCWD